MTLADELREQCTTRRVWAGCTVAEWLDTLDDNERPGMVDLLDQPKTDAGYVPSSELSRLLKPHGVDIQGQTFARHRRGDCACD